MLIHNFFSDVLLSVRTLFENYLFDFKTEFFQNNIVEKTPKAFIQSYQYSLGNRNYMIGDYKRSAQLEFPTAIITLGTDETAFGKQASLIGHHQIMHVNEIPVLFNNDTNKIIYLREEQTLISIQVQINCESQLQAKEIEHQIKRFLPVNKFIQFLKFTSFIELPTRFINKDSFNPLRHNITNLFYRTDPQTGDPNYCFSISYKPLIKLNSCQADISDPAARSWPVNLDFSYHIQTPMWIYAENEPGQAERINISIAFGEWEPIVDTIQQWGNPLEFAGQNFKPRFSFIVRRESDVTLMRSEDGSETSMLISMPNTPEYKFYLHPLKLFKSPNSVIIKPKEEMDSDISYTINDEKNELQLIFKNNTYDSWTPNSTKPLILQFLLPFSEEEQLLKKKQKHMFDEEFVEIPRED